MLAKFIRVRHLMQGGRSIVRHAYAVGDLTESINRAGRVQGPLE